MSPFRCPLANQLSLVLIIDWIVVAGTLLLLREGDFRMKATLFSETDAYC